MTKKKKESFPPLGTGFTLDYANRDSYVLKHTGTSSRIEIPKKFIPEEDLYWFFHLLDSLIQTGIRFNQKQVSDVLGVSEEIESLRSELSYLERKLDDAQ